MGGAGAFVAANHRPHHRGGLGGCAAVGDVHPGGGGGVLMIGLPDSALIQIRLAVTTTVSPARA